MNKEKIHRLIIGGPRNGDFAYWLGDVVELPDGSTYRRKKLTLDCEVNGGMYVYIHHSLTDDQALKLIAENYLGI